MRASRAETRRMPLRRSALVGAAIVSAAFALPAVASAKDFCVGAPAGCSGTAVSAPGLKAALTQAQSNGTDDRFFLAPGTYSTDNFIHESAEAVQIIGAGAGKTILEGNANGAVLDVGGNDSSSVSGLTARPVGAATTGLGLKGARAHGVSVDAKGALSIYAAVALFGNAVFDHGSVNIGAAQGHAAMVFSGEGLVSDSTLIAPAGDGFAVAAGNGSLRRSTVSGRFGAIGAEGHLSVTDTFIDLRGHAGGGLAAGLYVAAGQGANAKPTAAADAARLTIVGSTPTTSETVGVAAVADAAGQSADLRLRDSVISGIGVPVGRQASGGGTANITTTRSAYPSGVGTFDIGPGKLIEQSRLKVSPGFVGNGDFHLAAGSPLIDAGTAGSVTAAATDRDGRPRASDGNGDCSHITDIGAFEFQGTKTTALATVSAHSALAGQGLRFAAVKACIPGPEAPTLTWRFDDGAAATGTAAVHAFATAGHHTATLTVADHHGHQAVSSVAVDITAPPAIAKLRVTPKRVRIGTLLPKLVRTAAKLPNGTIRFTLSEPASVRLSFTKHGHTLKKRLRFTAHAGVNRIRFAARLSRTARLRPGTYRLTIVATDATGAHSEPATARFTAIAP
jgi:hypothetical protein